MLAMIQYKGGDIMFEIYKKENKEIRKKIKKCKGKIGIAFGGGGTRGLAHIGVLKAFEENGIEFDEVAGTSAGSIIGALYAYGLNSQEIYNFAKTLDEDEIRTSKIPFIPSKNEGLQNIIKRSIGDVYFDELKKSLTVVAVDLYTGQECRIKEGNVAKAVAGSCAVPLIFKPVEFDKYLLADGGLHNNIPADVVRNMGCKYVIAVDVNPTRGSGTRSTKLTDQLSACIGIAIKANCVKGRLFSDIIIEPNLQKFKNSSLNGLDEMIKIGYEETIKRMPEIKSLLRIGGPKRKLFSLFSKNKNKILYQSNKESVEVSTDGNKNKEEIK